MTHTERHTDRQTDRLTFQGLMRIAPRMTRMHDVNSLSIITPGLSLLVDSCTNTYSSGKLFKPSLTEVLRRQSARHRYGKRCCSVKLCSSSTWSYRYEAPDKRGGGVINALHASTNGNPGEGGEGKQARTLCRPKTWQAKRKTTKAVPAKTHGYAIDGEASTMNTIANTQDARRRTHDASGMSARERERMHPDINVCTTSPDAPQTQQHAQKKKKSTLTQCIFVARQPPASRALQTHQIRFCLS